MQAAHIRPSGHNIEDGNGGQALRNDRRPGHAVHIHAAALDEYDVQDHIQNARGSQNDQRRLGVARRPDHGGAEVIDKVEGNAQKIDLHILLGQRQHILRSGHGLQNSRGEGYTEDGQKNAADCRRGDGRMDGAEHRIRFPAADAMGNRHTRAYGQADKKIDNQIRNGAGSAHCRHGNAAAEPAHYNQIRRVEQQLQHTGQHNRDGIGHQRPDQGAPEHIPFFTLHVFNFPPK